MQGCFHAKIQNGDCIVKPLLDRGFYEGNLRGLAERNVTLGKRTTGIRCGCGLLVISLGSCLFFYELKKHPSR